MKGVRAQAFSIAAFLWGVAEATLFFIVPDVILSYIGMKRGVRAGVGASVIAALGAACGGVGMYLWSSADPMAARAAVLAVPAVSAAMAEAAETAMAQHWFMATLLGPLSSTPYKLYAVLAPAAGAPLWAFAAASALARLPRFAAVAAAAALLARWLGPGLGADRLVLVWAGAWALFYAVFFALMPN